MILTVHIDNRIISLAGYEEEQQSFFTSLGTDPLCTADQYAANILNVLRFHGADTDAFSGAVISSVVPSLTYTVRRAVELITGSCALIVGAGIKTGLNLRLDSAGTVGADFICCAVGALAEFAPPLVIINLAGAATFTAIDAQGVLIGRSILPGVESALEHLCHSAAQLPDVSFDPRAALVGRSTADAIRSGALYGAVSMVEGMLTRYARELGGQTTAVITGEIAPVIAAQCAQTLHCRPQLLHDGLQRLYQKNR